MPSVTGPNCSPSSPWARGTQSYQPAGSPNPTPVLPLCNSPLQDDPHSQNLSPGRLSPGYFGISGMKQGPPPSPKVHVLSQMPSFGDCVNSKDASEAPHVQRPGPSPEGDVSLPSPLKSPPRPRGQSIRSHKMTVFWKESPASEASENNVVSKSPGALASPSALSMSSTIASKSSRSAPTSDPTDRSDSMISPERCAELVQSLPGEVMLLDLRPYTHFAQATIRGSLNLCIPTTLLKRRSFDTQKLEATFTDEAEKGSFSKWKHCRYIIVYDAATGIMKDAAPLFNVLNKFTAEGWTGEGLVLRGGFNAFSQSFPGMTQLQQSRESGPSPNQLSMGGLPAVAPVAGGCSLPASSTAAVPFFANIRQNTDLLGGVGQVAPKLPERLTEPRRQLLPGWLRVASDPGNEGLNVSKKFLDLEKRELERMREALSYDKTDESIASGTTQCKRFRIAGIEMGSKNRYNDIYPFEHSRVRLQDVPSGNCDYVNASHLRAEPAEKTYIATQAPKPETFNDFWRMVWEQDVKVLVCLTAEMERGQVKCHQYWKTGQYGSLRVTNFSERHIPLSLDSHEAPRMDRSPRDTGVDNRTNEGHNPCIIARHISLSHSAFPFQPLREIIQLQYPYWPDFGTTAQPSHLVELIEQCDLAKSADTGSQAAPMLVHCSAGCGRTGSFCTVDSVLDTMKRGQRQEGQQDLIAQTVEEFRTQRPSMVQNLSQFVLCYESVLEWMAPRVGDDAMQHD